MVDPELQKQFEYMEIKKQKEVYRLDADMEYDPSNVDFGEWLASKFNNHETMDWYTKNALWIFWTRGDDEEVKTNDELSNPEKGNFIEEAEIAGIFKIETNIFNFETPLCKAYEEHKNTWIYEWNNDVPWVANMPWLDYGPWMEPSDDVEHVCTSFRFKNRHAKWPTCNWKIEKYFNGGDFLRVTQIGDEIYFESYEWYENLEDGKLKDEALNCKGMMEELMNVEEESSDDARTHYSPGNEWEDFEHANHIGAYANSNYNPTITLILMFLQYLVIV
ncbi:hypothetical protein Tco_0428131 [Tanacetum coccineum]